MENFATPKACSLLAVSCSVQAKQSGRAAARLGQGWTEGRCLLRLWWLQYGGQVPASAAVAAVPSTWDLGKSWHPFFPAPQEPQGRCGLRL